MDLKEDTYEYSALTASLIQSAKVFVQELPELESIYLIRDTSAFTDLEIKEWHRKDRKYLALAIATVLCAYSHIESVVNCSIHQCCFPEGIEDLGVDANLASQLRTELAKAAKRTGKFNTSEALNKSNILLNFLGKAPLNQTAKAYRNADLLRRLRNVIAHASPSWEVSVDGVTSKSHKVEELEKLSQELVEVGVKALDWYKGEVPRCLLTAQCAEWSIASSEEFVRTFIDATGLKFNHSSDWRQGFTLKY